MSEMQPQNEERSLPVVIVHVALAGLLLIGLLGFLAYASFNRRPLDPVRVKAQLPSVQPTVAPLALAPTVTPTPPPPTPTRPAPTPLPTATPVQALDAKIEVVWPHDNQPVDKATLVNVTTYLLMPGTLNSVPCDFDRPVRLWRGSGTQPPQFVALGNRHLVTEGNRILPTWDFNDVTVSPGSSFVSGWGAMFGQPDTNTAAAALGTGKSYFYVAVDGMDVNSNVWSHAADARTYMPTAVQPTEVGGQPSEVDARIQIVWPHDNLPVDQARKVNIVAALFEAGQTRAIDPSWDGTVRLYQALNNEPLRPVAVGKKRLVQSNGLTYAVWDFNDIDVSAARDRLNKYYFQVRVDGIKTNPMTWSHGADARTYAPYKDQAGGGCLVPQPTPTK